MRFVALASIAVACAHPRAAGGEDLAAVPSEAPAAVAASPDGEPLPVRWRLLVEAEARLADEQGTLRRTQAEFDARRDQLRLFERTASPCAPRSGFEEDLQHVVREVMFLREDEQRLARLRRRVDRDRAETASERQAILKALRERATPRAPG